MPELADKTLVAGVVDGHNIWRTDLEAALGKLASLLGSAAHGGGVDLVLDAARARTRWSAETDLDDALRSWLAFADQKVAEVVTLARALHEGRDAVADEIAASNAADRLPHAATRVCTTAGPGPHRRDRRVRDASAAPRPSAASSQDARLHLPPLPTTTIGSFPQTAESARRAPRSARARSTRREYDEPDAGTRSRDVVELQEELGLDVLVHGEPERNDMVQYFAEQPRRLRRHRRTAGCSPTAAAARARRSSGATSPGPHPITVDWVDATRSR